MMFQEYLILDTVNHTIKEMSEILSIYGRDGWKIVAVSGSRIYM